MVIWHMHIAFWITNATHTHTHSEYVILIAFPPGQCLHELASLLRYTYAVCALRTVCLAVSQLWHELHESGNFLQFF